ncbi:MAG: hypothetical protein ACLFPB_02850 [Desulfovermiculus sp.]
MIKQHDWEIRLNSWERFQAQHGSTVQISISQVKVDIGPFNKILESRFRGND